MTLSLYNACLYIGVLFSAPLILLGEWYSLVFRLQGKVFHLFWQACSLSSTRNLRMSSKCETSYYCTSGYLGATLGSFAMRLWVLMIAIGLDYSDMIIRGFTSSLDNTFFIFVAISSSWFIQDGNDINYKSPRFGFGSHIFKAVKAKLCR